ncbi:MAG TPA: hypothetical protein VLQ80_31065 [Candidatus Saccharimonadia bacterium]|nr:hypothetical protein [Candidatus Saccharimonadia bacterium]
MQSIPIFPTCDYAEGEGVHGLPWHTIFRMRNAVAFRWAAKFHEQVPPEEFLSECNEEIVRCIRVYTPQPPCTFGGFLYRALVRRMPSVPRRYWAGGTNEYQYDRPGRGHKRLGVVLQGPNLCELPRDPRLYDSEPPRTPLALTLPATQEDATFLGECLAYVAAHLSSVEQAYLWDAVEGDSSTESAARYGVHQNTIQRRLIAARAHLLRWADQVRTTAAD